MAAIRTSDGRLVDPLNITSADVIPSVLIHSICLLNRFTGHTIHPYSVGQHTLNLVRYVPKELRRAALIHDWQEAWFNDMASPLKAEMPDYKKAEHEAGQFVAFVMGVPAEEMEAVDQYDKAIYINERDALFPVVNREGMGDERKGLPNDEGTLRFNEYEWRYVRSALTIETRALFPDWNIGVAGE